MKKAAAGIIIFFFIISANIFPAEIKISKIEPPNWWAGMKVNQIQLMVYGENLNDVVVKSNEDDFKIVKVYEADNPSYLFVDVEISSSIIPGNYKLFFEGSGVKTEIDFPILKRNEDSSRHNGFNSSDIVYLIMPDRFANGDTLNDTDEGFIDSLNRNHPSRRHGGDLQGIINHLDYFNELGVTALWINPVVENNMQVSYHGYAATDLYKIDPRLGTNELYKELVNQAHEQGLKIIYDHVANHIGINHPWVKNLPIKDWLNGTVESHKLSNHQKLSASDPHASSEIRTLNTDGWFTEYMPDLNQRNPFVANYLIQNMIWWIEYSGLDGIREDTYPYADQKFLSEWNKIILNEYPRMNIVGEAWEFDPVFTSYYQRNNFYPREFNTNLPSVMDFGFSFTSFLYLKGERKLNAFYEHFAKDFIYPDPDNLFTFLDNHDWERAIFTAGGNIEKFKIPLTILLTTRGIPQLLYGTEIGIIGDKDHGRIRSDFPGGFPGDEHNAFISSERTERETQIFDYVKSLIELRKNFKSLSAGKMIHFPPADEIYYYFKIYENEKILVIINGNETEKEIQLNNTENYFSGTKNIVNLLTKAEIEFSTGMKFNLKPMSCLIYLLK